MASETTPLRPSPDEGLGHTWPAAFARSWLARVLFAWIDPLMALSARRALALDDLFQLDPHSRAASVGPAFEGHWRAECDRDSAAPSLVRALVATFGGTVARAGVLKLVLDSLQFVLPLMIQRILAFIQNPTAPQSQGLVDVAIVAVVSLTQSLLLRNYAFMCFETGLRVRTALSAAVFRKTLALSSASRRRTTTGEITNLVTADAARVQDVATHINSLWFSVFQITVACVLLWQQLGVAMVAGVAVIVAMIPTTAALSRRMHGVQRALFQAKDARLKSCCETLAGIKVIKLQAWESLFQDRVLATRHDELARLDDLVHVRGATTAMFAAIPMLVAAAAFLAFVLLGHALDVGTALTSLAFFNILRFPLLGFPQLLQSVVAAGVSVERLRCFLLEDERRAVCPGDLQDVGIRVRDADFAWDADDTPVLQSVDMEASSGQLWAVVGRVGAGKTTLLSGILGDARCTRGSIAVCGSVAYVSQQPFIQNASVRDNITFGLAFDANRYAQAIRVSALGPDLAVLPAGDATEIGEKGVNLSGGQRTRVALARAVYQDADIYVLDDVLAAVDSHVGRDIFAQCIRTTLRDKLVVLATHNLTFLHHCDRVLVLNDGRVAEQGAFTDVMALDGGVLQRPVTQSREHNDDAKAGTVKAVPADESTPLSETRKETVSGQLMTDEDHATGDVAWHVYQWYLDAMGGTSRAVGVVGVFCVVQAIDVFATLSLSRWSEHAAIPTTSQLQYLAVFVALNALFALGLYARSLAVYLYGLSASHKLFEAVFRRVLRAPIAFFDTTPLGRITNRLSKDVYAVDESLPATVIQLATTLVSVAATLVTISVVTPAFLVVVLPVAAGFIVSQRYFVKTSRELQRLDAISRSPVVALLTESLDGLPTIHASGIEQLLAQRYDALLDRSQRAYFLTFAINGWLGLRLDVVGTVVATGAALSAVLMAHGASVAVAGLAGVSLSYAFSVTHALNHSVRTLSRVQMHMVSVERLQTYATMERESADGTICIDAAWPRDGAIEFRNVSLRYRSTTPLVLDDVSLTIRAREHIGVVGRTGAGKSSLVVALLRLVELEAGAIVIDGTDVRTLGLHDLRSRISMIPQDPVLFSGTVRSNVDPLDAYSDDQIWTALRRAMVVVPALDARVDEKGANWSLGQRQLLCIARALLARSRILVMDEATASIDAETDRAIQRVVRDELRTCTCVTIAHRLNTVLDADRILVMDSGAVAEFDTPAALQANPTSRFKALVHMWRAV